MSTTETSPTQEILARSDSCKGPQAEESPSSSADQRVENTALTVADEDAQLGTSDSQVSVNEASKCIEVPSVEATVESSGALCEMAVPSLGHVHSYYEEPESDDSDSAEDDDDGTDSTELANRIRSLTETLASRSRPMLDSSTPPQIPERVLRDSITGQPVPFPDAAFLTDKDMIDKLKNTLVMNGHDGPHGKQMLSKSVWDVLDSFKAPSAHKWCAGLPDDYASSTGPLNTLPTSSEPHIIADDSSVMMYFPLVPDESSQVELAQSNIVPMTTPHADKEKPKMKKLLKRYRMYETFKKDEGEVERGKTLTWKFWSLKKRLTSPSAEVITSPAPTTPNPEVKERVWVPSSTNMSVQALWWGYRIFLPPPVLDVLSHEEIEATKRVSMISSSLSWMFANLPVAMFPPPMQPALMMLQKLVPYLSYIGTFISWSWDTVKSFDTGRGVILSATWLLPVALIPGTWEAYDYPQTADNTEDPKLEFAARLPLPPSSVSLASPSASSLLKPNDSRLSSTSQSHLSLPPSSTSLASPSARMSDISTLSSCSIISSTSLAPSTNEANLSSMPSSASLALSPPASQLSVDTSVSTKGPQQSVSSSSLAAQPSSSSHSISIKTSTYASPVSQGSSVSSPAPSSIFPLPSPYSASKIQSTSAQPGTPSRPITGLPQSPSSPMSPNTLDAAARAVAALDMLNGVQANVGGGEERQVEKDEVVKAEEAEEKEEEKDGHKEKKDEKVENVTEQPDATKITEVDTQGGMVKSDSVLSDRTNRVEFVVEKDDGGAASVPMPKEQGTKQDKKEKRKSRGLVGGLWRLLTGSG
ncbi:hypothetical protein VNI00_006267 [Paramarasmius palmivorus]|uniref:Uncharacterized protein n=1 Tax=Paramarasmius palmivorus TaxID=297713 RepID=A0AAW0D8E4_9AGAR